MVILECTLLYCSAANDPTKANTSDSQPGEFRTSTPNKRKRGRAAYTLPRSERVAGETSAPAKQAALILRPRAQTLRKARTLFPAAQRCCAERVRVRTFRVRTAASRRGKANPPDERWTSGRCTKQAKTRTKRRTLCPDPQPFTRHSARR